MDQAETATEEICPEETDEVIASTEPDTPQQRGNTHTYPERSEAMTPRGEYSSSIITEVARWPIDGLEGKEGRILTVEYPPGVHTPAHRHPGWMFIRVLEGKIVSQMDGEPAREYGPGEVWYEDRDHLHLDAGNDSPDSWAKILIFYLTEPGQPVLVPEEASEPA